MTYEIDLACGRLRIETLREDLPLAALLGFASRRNPRRGFLFVSRVLGKHLPCPPRVMRDAYERLTTKALDLIQDRPGPALVVGLAETATGLGGGVADSLARRDPRRGVFFQHTTRHPLAAPLLVRFDEVHSHAPDHLLYTPDPALADRYQGATSLLLVDDELTTGRTLAALTDQIAQRLPALKEVLFVSLVNWLDRHRRQAIAASLAVPVRFVSLLEGTFQFEPSPTFAPTLPDGVCARRPPLRPPRADTGRRGLLMPTDSASLDGVIEDLATMAEDGPSAITVIGTGELAYPPFLLAERLEQAGCDVLYQGTTRSPILADGDISGSLSFLDEHGEGVQNYLHNPPSGPRRSIIVYESREHAKGHPLPGLLGADIWIVPPLT